MTGRNENPQQDPNPTMPGSRSPPLKRHDALFREAFSDPERANVLLRWVLPDSIVSSFADELPKVLSPAFVDEDLAATQCDILLKVRLKAGRDAYFLPMLEHKSRNDPWVILQVGGYMFQTWQRIATQDRLKPGELPPILPVVFYHGEEPWTAPTSLGEAMNFRGLPEEAFPFGFWYILHKIREVPHEELPRHPEVLPVLIAIRGAQPELLVPLLGAIGMRNRLSKQLLRYALGVGDKQEMDALIAALPEAQRNELEVEMDSVIATSIREGETRGIAKGEVRGEARGLAKGRAEGEARGRADTLLRFLEHRFGPLRPDLRDRVSSASLDQLQRWVDDTPAARSPEEALGLPGTS